MHYTDTSMKQLTIIVLCALLLGVFLRHACGQDTTRVSRDASIIDQGNNKHLMQIQRGQNYQDDAGTWHRWTVDIDSEATYVNGAIKYNVKHQRGKNLFRAGLDSSVWKFEYDGVYVVQRLIDPRKENATWSQSGEVTWKNVLKATDVTLTPTPDGVKEDIILKGAASPDTLTFEMEVSIVPEQTATGVNVGPLTLPNPTATDGDGAPVPVTWTWTGPVAGKYTVNIVPDKSGGNYPITIDPTITITGTNAFYARGQNATYATARGYTNGTGAGNVVVIIGQQPGFYIDRGFMAFSLAAINADTVLIDSVRLVADGGGDASTTNFNVLTFPSRHRSNSGSDSTAFDDFQYWASGVNPYAGNSLTKVWNTAQYSAGLNYFTFTEAGEDTVAAHIGDTLKIVQLSAEDSAASAPAASEYVQWTTAAPAPVLEIFYQVAFRTTSITAVQDTGLRVVYDTTSAGLPGGKMPDTLSLAYWSDSSIVVVGQWHIPSLHGGAFTDTVFGLRGDSMYRVIAIGFSNGDTAYSAVRDSERTYAQAPTIDTLAGYSPASLYLSLDQDANQATTRIAVKDCTYNRFITTGGDTAGGTLWATKSQWKGIVIDVPRRHASTKFKFVAIAKNGDSLLTAFSVMDSAWTNAFVKTIDLTRIDSGRFAFTTTAESLDATFAHTYFVAIDKDGDGGKDTVLTDTTTVTVTAQVGGTFTDTTRSTNAVLHPNQRIKFRLQRRDNPDTTVYCALDTFFTDAVLPSLDTFSTGSTIQFYSDTSFKIQINLGTNWTCPLIALEDSYSITVDSPRTWIHPTQFTLTADTAWVDTTVIGRADTIVITRSYRPWPQNVRTKPWIYVQEGDSTYNGLK